MSNHWCYVWQWLCPSRLCWCRCHDVISLASRLRPRRRGGLPVVGGRVRWLSRALSLIALGEGLFVMGGAMGGAPVPVSRRGTLRLWPSLALVFFRLLQAFLLSFFLLFGLLSLEDSSCMAMPKVTLLLLFTDEAGWLRTPSYVDSCTVRPGAFIFPPHGSAHFLFFRFL